MIISAALSSTALNPLRSSLYLLQPLCTESSNKPVQATKLPDFDTRDASHRERLCLCSEKDFPTLSGGTL